MTNKCVVESCFHCFCFVCLKQWAKKKTVCPMCTQPLSNILYAIQSETNYKEFFIPQRPPSRKEQLDSNDSSFTPASSHSINPVNVNPSSLEKPGPSQTSNYNSEQCTSSKRKRSSSSDSSNEKYCHRKKYWHSQQSKNYCQNQKKKLNKTTSKKRKRTGYPTTGSAK